MVVQSWLDILRESFVSLFYGIVVDFIPSLLFAIIVFIIGWIVGVVLGKVVAQVVHALKVDHALRSAGVDDVVTRAGYKLDSGMFLGELVKWFVIVVFLIASLDILQLTQVTLFIELALLPFLGNVIIAVLILLIAAVVAEIAQHLVTGTARAAGIVSAGFVGVVARWAIWVFAVIVALSQLQIASGIIQVLFTGVVAALSIAFGLAFGLGGQETAGAFLNKMRSQMRE